MPTWTLQKWNQALYEHYFVGEFDEVEPLRLLWVTPEELATIRGFDDPEHARRAFGRIMASELEHRSLQLHAAREADSWSGSSSNPPPFVAHLLLTCLAACDTHREVAQEDDFRKRLEMLIDRNVGTLYGLPELWKQLAQWLEFARMRDRRIRSLALPRSVGNETIIGITKRLAFPPRRDVKLLHGLLESHDLLGHEPPLLDVIGCVRSETGFSQRFERAFAAFSRRLEAGEMHFDDDPFWNVVRKLACNPARFERLETSAAHAWSLQASLHDARLELYLASPQPWQADGFFSEPFDDHRGCVRHAIRSTSEVGDPYNDAVLAALNNHQALPTIAGLELAARQGVLLFVPDEDGDYHWSARRPRSRGIRALIVPKHAEPFERSLREHTTDVSLVESTLPGWYEVLGLQGFVFEQVDFVDGLKQIRALQLTQPPARLSLFGGILLGAGQYLGLGPYLPRVRVPGATSVVLRQGETMQRIALQCDEPGIWSIPDTGQSLSGTWLLEATLSRATLRKQINFELSHAHTDYKWPRDRTRWQCEGSARDTVSLEPPTGRLASSGDLQLLEGLEALGAAPIERFTLHQQVEYLELLLAATSSRRTGIEERELLELVRDVFAIDSWALIWGIVRAWCETGALVRSNSRHWSSRRYFAVPPFGLLYRAEDLYCAVFGGLRTPDVQGYFTQVAEAHQGLPLAWGGRWVRGVQHAWFDTRTSAQQTLECLLGKGAYRCLTLEPMLAPLDVVQKGEGLLNYQRHASWNWEGRYFGFDATSSPGGQVELVNRRIRGRPQLWTVGPPGASATHYSFSRTWSLLAAYEMANISPFVLREERTVLTRSVYLPLTIAQQAHWLGAPAPGPTDDGRVYQYHFPSAGCLQRLLAYYFGDGTPLSRQQNSQGEEDTPDLGDVLQMPAEVEMALDPDAIDPRELPRLGIDTPGVRLRR